VRLVVVSVVVLIGCWADPSPSTPVPAAIEPAKPRVHHTTWMGHYSCAQGVTAVKLVLDILPTGETTGVFEFSAAPENPGVPSGSYHLRGVTTATKNGVVTVDVEGDSWIEQPKGYMMVGLRASSDPTRRHLSGQITNESCGDIEVERRD
jgi:hypothetical protein